jgi:hypothetical protein
MTGSQQIILGGSGRGLPNAAFSAALNNLSATAGIYTASLQLFNDGTSAKVPAGSGVVNWWLPTTVSVGAGIWARLTITTQIGGVSFSNSPLNSWVQLNVTRTWSISNTVSSSNTTGVLALELATDAAGNNRIAIYNNKITWAVGRSA